MSQVIQENTLSQRKECTYFQHSGPINCLIPGVTMLSLEESVNSVDAHSGEE